MRRRRRIGGVGGGGIEEGIEDGSGVGIEKEEGREKKRE